MIFNLSMATSLGKGKILNLKPENMGLANLPHKNIFAKKPAAPSLCSCSPKPLKDVAHIYFRIIINYFTPSKLLTPVVTDGFQWNLRDDKSP